MPSNRNVPDRGKRRKQTSAKSTGVNLKTRTAGKDHLQRSYLLAFVPAILAFVLYTGSLSHQFAFDDALVITENNFTKQGFAGIPKLVSTDFFTGIYGEEAMELTGGRYRPLSLVMFAVENQLLGTRNTDTSGHVTYSYNPFAGHLINVLLYSLSCALLFLLLLNWFPDKNLIAWTAAILFAVHPVHTEVVANIKSRDEILALLFVLSSLLFYHKYLLRGKHPVVLGASCLSFFLAMLAKENAFTYMAIIPILAYTVYRKESLSWFRFSVPFWISAVLYLILRTSLVGLPSTEETNPSILENPFANSDLSEKVGSVGLFLLKYLGLVIYPLRLVSDYSYAQIPFVSLNNPLSLISWLLHLGLAILVILSIRRRNPLAAAITMYLFPLGLVSNLLFNVGAPMGERFLYMSTFGYALAFGLLLSHFCGWQNLMQWKRHIPLAAALVLLCGLYAQKSFMRVPDWKNNETLFGADVQEHPNSAKLQYYYANTMMKKQMADPENPGLKPLLDTAFVHFKRSAEIYPNFQIGWYNIALSLVQQQKGREALPYVERSLQINANHGLSLSLLGQIYGRYLNEPVKALPPLLRCANVFGMKQPGIYQSIGICYAMTGKLDSAVYYFDRALELAPGDVPLTQNKIQALEQAGRTEEALKLRQSL